MFSSNTSEIENIRLDTIVDDINNSTVGYSFVTEPANTFYARHKKMLDHLRASQTWDSLLQIGLTGLTVDPKA
jgi:3'-phosphoadenosine 5'-phosphosulfate sulfotransferase